LEEFVLELLGSGTYFYKSPGKGRLRSDSPRLISSPSVVSSFAGCHCQPAFLVAEHILGRHGARSTHPRLTI
jgi:hypothetical protein